MPRSVAVLMVGKDRISQVQPCIETLYRRTSALPEILYVDAASPRPAQQLLESLSRQYSFRLTRQSTPMTPNAARQLGMGLLQHHRYLAILENHVLVEPGWLDALQQTALRTAAPVVVPITNRQLTVSGSVPIPQQQQQSTSPESSLSSTDAADPAWATCLLIDLDQVDPSQIFDAEMPGPLSHCDLWLALRRAGKRIERAPAAIVTSCDRAPLRQIDEPLFSNYWDDAVLEHAVARFAAKWQVSPEHPELAVVLSQLRSRRTQLLGQLRLHRLLGHRGASWWRRVSTPLHRLLNSPSAA